MSVLHTLKTVKYNSDVIIVDDELLYKIQHTLLDMMKDIAEVCDKANIPWCLSGGSIIGAVRHHGFIPWDDDMDIFMEREAYRHFCEIFDKYLSNKYELKVPGDDGYLLHYPQIQKKGTKIKYIQSKENSYDGIFIDIFIFENTYNNKIMRGIHGIKCTLLLFINSVLRMDACKNTIFKYSGNDKHVKKIVMSRARYAKFFKFKSLEEWLKISDKCFSSVKKKTKYVVAPGGGHHFFGEVFERKYVCKYIPVDFCNEHFFIPEGYDYYLCKRYGQDYMTLPKEEERERHIYIEIDLGD